VRADESDWTEDHLANFGELGRAGAGTTKGRWRTNTETPTRHHGQRQLRPHGPPDRPLHAMPPVVNA